VTRKVVLSAADSGNHPPEVEAVCQCYSCMDGKECESFRKGCLSQVSRGRCPTFVRPAACNSDNRTANDDDRISQCRDVTRKLTAAPGR
jgi:hypothetical protein